MPNFRKIDEKDFVFIDISLTETEERQFSEFLKSHKTKKAIKKKKERVSQKNTIALNNVS